MSLAPPMAGSTCVLALAPDAAAARALRATAEAYDWLMQHLAAAIPPDAPGDVVAWHRRFYEQARVRTALPAQLVTLGFRDFAARRRGEAVDGLPLDARLFSIKTLSQVSIASIEGRLTVPYRVVGYQARAVRPFAGRLVEIGGRFELWAATADAGEAQAETREERMGSESVVNRIGRVIAGMAHAVVDGAEAAQPIAVLEQAVREIDQAADEVRLEAGKAIAERHRLAARREELAAELRDLDEKIGLAIGRGADDLAKAGIERQLDIEAQVKLLDRLIGEVDARIATTNETLDAIKASRREAESRLADFRRSLGGAPDGASAAAGPGALDGAADRVRRAEAVASRITGVPVGAVPPKAEAIDKLDALARDHAVEERLARFKSSLG